MKDKNSFNPNLSLLTAGRDRHYSLGLASALAGAGLALEVVGGDDLECEEFRQSPQIRFLNLRGDQRQNAGLLQKILRVLIYYFRLLAYAATTRTEIFHILWNNKFELFDRTLLMCLYKLLGKKIALTAHNINAAARDGCDSPLNRATLRFQYRLCDLIFVHTNKMKSELVSEFKVSENKIVLIPFGVNNAVPRSSLTRSEARAQLGLDGGDRVILFFGSLAPYKGLDYLVEAFETVEKLDPLARLVIAGHPKGPPEYWAGINRNISSKPWRDRVVQKIEYVSDAQIEIFFKAADVLAMPYVHIFQSGVLFLAHSFGLPVIAADVGAFKEEIVEGKTGFVCRSRDADDLARALQKYFQSDLYHHLSSRRHEILSLVNQRHSWTEVASITAAAYRKLLRRMENSPSGPEENSNHETLSFDSHSGLQR